MKPVRFPFRFPLLFPNTALRQYHRHLHMLLKHINSTANLNITRYNLKCATGTYIHQAGSAFRLCYLECLDYGTGFLYLRMKKIPIL